MKCPSNCDTPLLMTERIGIEIDYCPTCRGVWLDRGELDKIIDRAAADTGGGSGADPRDRSIGAAPIEAPPAQGYPPAQVRSWSTEARPTPYRSGEQGRSGHGQKKRKGFLGDLFDF